MKKVFILLIALLSFIENFHGQTNEIKINADLNVETHTLHIQQEIIFHNNSDVSLDTIFLHNWMNTFKDNETPLAKRLIED